VGGEGGWGWGKLSFQCLRPSASLRAAGNNVFIEFIKFIVKSKPFFSKNSIKIFFDKFDKFFEKWTL
jgi:hypothetical protein